MELNRDEICPLDVLGAGEFGEVFKALYTRKVEYQNPKDAIYVSSDYTKRDGYEVVAVKTLKGVKGEVNREEKETLMAEVG